MAADENGNGSGRSTDTPAGAIAMAMAVVTGPPLHEGSTLTWFTVLYALVLIYGLFGNMLTIGVIRRTRDLHSNTNFFLCNLAFSDLLLLTSGIPFDLIYMWRTYPAIAGTWHCIVKAQLSEMASNVSILTILILTIERWVAICRPLHLYVYFNRDHILAYIGLIWVIGGFSALFLSVQFAVIPYSPPNSSLVYEHVTQCDVDPSLSIPYVFEITSIVFFVIPMSMIVGAYGSIIHELNQCRNLTEVMRKATSTPLENGPQLKARFLIIVMLITVASVFFVCFLPLHVQRLMTTYDKERISSSHENAYFSRIWFTVAGLLHFVSAATNPIIYNLMSRRFRLACRSMIVSLCTYWTGFCCCCCCSTMLVGVHEKKSDQGDAMRIELRRRHHHCLSRPDADEEDDAHHHRSTDTTSFKERFALWLLGTGGRRSRWTSCYVQCQSMDANGGGAHVMHACGGDEHHVQQEWL